MFCSKCGARRISENNTHHLKSNRFSKKTKLGLGVAIVVAFFILVGVSGSINQQQIVQEKSETKQFIDKPLTEILPTREDIGTEWIMSDAVDLQNERKGFIEGTTQTFTKTSGGFNTIETINIERFDSLENAHQIYSEKNSLIKQAGGYEEISTGSVSATCYGFKKEGLYSNSGAIICYKNNIYFVIQGYGDFDVEDDTKDMAKVVAKNII